MDPTPVSPIDALLDSTTGDLARLVRELAERLAGEHAARNLAALDAAKRDAATALAAAVDDERARARVELEHALSRAKDETDRAVRETEDRLRAEAEEARQQAAAEAESAASGLRREGEERETRLRQEHDARLDEQRLEYERKLAANAASATSTGTEARVDEREHQLQSAERLLAAFERLDAATTLRATLDALAEAVGAECPRSLVLLAREDQLRGWRATGIAPATEVAGITVPLASAGPIRDAVTSCARTTLHANTLAGETAGTLSFLDLAEDQAGLAVPVVVDGRSVAVVYADDGAVTDREVPGSWPETIQVLARHAARCLEVLTARGAAGLRRPEPGAHAMTSSMVEVSAADAESARRFARLVVSEIRMYNEPAVTLGREAGDLRVRLADHIARARRLYEARVPVSLPGRDEYFELELVHTLADGDVASLGHADSEPA